jgi:hypothetical protein
MVDADPFAYRRLFNLSMSYGGSVFLLLCAGPLQELFSNPVTAESLRAAGAGIGGLLPVGMGISALIAGMVRKVLFRHSGINRRSLGIIFLLGAFWHLPLTLCLASAARTHEPETAEKILLYFPGISLVAAASLTLTLYLSAPQRRIKEK